MILRGSEKESQVEKGKVGGLNHAPLAELTAGGQGKASAIRVWVKKKRESIIMFAPAFKLRLQRLASELFKAPLCSNAR